MEYKEVANSVSSLETERKKQTNKNPKPDGLLCFQGIGMGPNTLLAGTLL